jgi:hypothetical protein
MLGVPGWDSGGITVCIFVLSQFDIGNVSIFLGLGLKLDQSILIGILDLWWIELQD